MYKPSISAKVGESGAAFLMRNGLSAEGNVDRQPAGMNFYQYRWKTERAGEVVFDHGAFSFTIPNALTVMGTENLKHSGDGVESLFVNATFSSDKTITHDAARIALMKIIKELVSLGWKRYIAYSDPRLVGEQAFNHYLGNNFYSLPVDFVPNLQQWMQIDVGFWNLYADGVFLEIRFHRDSEHLDLNKPGAYLLVFNFETKTSYGRSMFDGEEREQWQEHWAELIKKAKKDRYAKEAELVKRGFTIDTTYQDPKIHPADPVEP
ncbi:MAG TPA: hypothetical protein PKC70_11655 [Cellvibrionaceae bacterium]|nr:hypothetical protein [Cellvibrionaceae bacterium]HNG59737.1 hypothetical protein [Cellvibrionaceae bacterium]